MGNNHPNNDLALSLYADLWWNGAGSADVLAAAGEHIGWHARMGKVKWSPDTSRWVSLDLVRDDLKDVIRYFEMRLPDWEWSLRKSKRKGMKGHGYICHVGRIDESGTDRIVARTAEGAMCLGLLHALGCLPLHGPWLGASAELPEGLV